MSVAGCKARSPSHVRIDDAPAFCWGPLMKHKRTKPDSL